MDLFDWAKPVSKNDEERVNDLLRQIYFGPVKKEHVGLLNYERNLHCPTPIEEFFAEPENYFWLINSSTNQIYGVCEILDDSITINGYRFFYVDVRCTFNKTGDDYITSGRLLWSYILNHFGKLWPKFVVYNFSTPEAKGYHLKMGMKPYAESEVKDIINEENVIKLPYIKEDIPGNTELEKVSVFGITSTNYAGGNMFYISNPSIKYNKIYDIIMSLQLSETMMEKGGKKYKRRTSREPKNTKKTNRKLKRQFRKKQKSMKNKK